MKEIESGESSARKAGWLPFALGFIRYEGTVREERSYARSWHAVCAEQGLNHDPRPAKD
jgi:hypothetical protein